MYSVISFENLCFVMLFFVFLLDASLFSFNQLGFFLPSPYVNSQFSFSFDSPINTLCISHTCRLNLIYFSIFRLLLAVVQYSGARLHALFGFALWFHEFCFFKSLTATPFWRDYILFLLFSSSCWSAFQGPISQQTMGHTQAQRFLSFWLKLKAQQHWNFFFSKRLRWLSESTAKAEF